MKQYEKLVVLVYHIGLADILTVSDEFLSEDEALKPTP